MVVVVVAAAPPHRLVEDREALAPPLLDRRLLGARRLHRRLAARLAQGAALQEDMEVAHTTEEVQQFHTDQGAHLAGA